VLAYELEQAPNEKAIIRQCLMAGKPYPAKIKNAPELDLPEIFYYNAFWTLNTTRNYELAPISYFAVKDYCLDLSLTRDQFDRLCFIIDEIDSWFLKYTNDKIQKEISKPVGKTKNGGKK